RAHPGPLGALTGERDDDHLTLRVAANLRLHRPVVEHNFIAVKKKAAICQYVLTREIGASYSRAGIRDHDGCESYREAKTLLRRAYMSTHSEMIIALQEFVGDWNVTQKIWTSPNNEPTINRGRSTCTSILGGTATLMVTEMQTSNFKGVA